MFPKWRFILRKAEHALRTGQLTDARDLINSADVQSYRPVRNLAGKLGNAFALRAEQHCDLGDSVLAWNDLQEAEKLGTSDPTKLGALKKKLTEQAVAEAEKFFESGQPALAVRSVDRLAKRGASSSQLRVIKEAAKLWLRAEEMAKRARFNEAIQQLQSVANLVGSRQPLDQKIAEWTLAKEDINGLELRLHAALVAEDWANALELAESILGHAPNHSQAQTARKRCWAHVEARTAPARSASMLADELIEESNGCASNLPGFQMWIDAVGGYLVCSKNRISIGQPTGPGVDVGIMAEISRLHAWVERDTEGYFLRSHRTAYVNDRPIHEKHNLIDGDLITLGDSVRLKFLQPNPISATARLEMASPHRFHPAVDAIVLLADTCVIGPNKSAHIQASEWNEELVLFANDSDLWCRASGELDVDGAPCSGKFQVTPPARLSSETIAVALEPLDHDDSTY